MTLLFVVAASLWIFSAPLRHLDDALRYVMDDFYYYIKIAANVTRLHRSTFDGVRLTNGYHPLYLLFWIPVVRVGQSLAVIFSALYVLMIAASITTFVFARRLLAMSGASAMLVNGLALVALALPFRMFFQGMEVILTIPLCVAVLYCWARMFRDVEVAPWRAAVTGLLAVAMVLSRLDSALFIFLLLLATLASAEMRRKLSLSASAAFAACAGIPLALYVCSNRIWFHTWMPVSGMAKQLRNSHVPSAIAIQSLTRGTNGKMLLLIAALAIAGWFLMRRRLPQPLRAVLCAAVFFPLLHNGALILLSDWQMWGWYHYSFVPATLALLFFIAMEWQRRAALAPRAKFFEYAAVALLAVGAIITATNHWKLDHEMAQIARTSQQLAPWMDAHPGQYAMGDRAGMVAWLTTQPMFQTEGLVEDREWLNVLRAQGDLTSALREKGVRYYITTEWLEGGPAQRLPVPAPPGCFHAIEPAQAGASAPHLESMLCAPIAVFDTAPGDEMPKRTLVFDLSR